MNKINKENIQDLKTWPFKQADEIIKRHGGYSNFNIPQKNTYFLKLAMDPQVCHILGPLVKWSELQWSKLHSNL